MNHKSRVKTRGTTKSQNPYRPSPFQIVKESRGKRNLGADFGGMSDSNPPPSLLFTAAALSPGLEYTEVLLVGIPWGFKCSIWSGEGAFKAWKAWKQKFTH
ncbi:hypothetical protein M9H77_23891 [Catharanthus roseus]|uniref:Uncharacterized protein n=1 Tax=Catharanthus roseus TaxID=4058 RepID=A0ACC0AYQ4_CATRO|nr:hypothetical protein M9H77_23891 [Catharanthus roseus]